MRTFSSMLPSGVRRLFRLPMSRARMAREMDDETRFHIDMRAAELRALGVSEPEARAEALRRFGDADDFREYAARRASRRARWHAILDWLESWTQDIQFASRQFRKHAGFTALAVLTLALGIGANTAIFTVVHRLLLAPLPYPDGNRIVMLTLGDGERSDLPNAAMLRSWRARAHSIETIGTVSVQALAVQNDDGQDTVYAFITPNYLKMLGEPPTLGRAFTQEDARAGAPPVAMISYARWQREFGGRADALGAPVHVSWDTVGTLDRIYTIVGVAPRNMALPMSSGSFNHNLHEATPGTWLPESLDAMDDRDRPNAYARLRPGYTAQQASKELQSIVDGDPELSKAHPHVRAMRWQDFLDPRETRMVQVLFAAVGVLLLIACANVANLLMSRAWTRRREFAVRVALGAGRGRLARQVLTESVMLALGGGLFGVGVASLTLKIIIALRPPSLDNLAGAHLASTVLLWSAGISVGTGILFGSAPALFAGAHGVGDVLRNESRTGSGGIASQRMRSALIVFEIAMSLVLLVGAGLLVRSFVALQRMPLGFEPRGLVAFDVLFHPGLTREARPALRSEIVRRLAAVPGVSEAAVGMLPGVGYGDSDRLETEPDVTGQTRSVPAFSVMFVGSNFFRVARMAVVEGRVPDSLTAPQQMGPGARAPSEVVVSRELARRFWPDGHVVGSRMHSSDGVRLRETYVVVGVADDVRLPGARDAARAAQIYLLPKPFGASFLVRTATPTAELTATLRRVIASVEPTPYVQTWTVGDTYLRDSMAPTRFAMALLAAFSTIALLLSAIGLYGVIAYSVTQRTREIGVRVALGADPKAIAGLFVGNGLRLAIAGVIIGVAGAVAATRALTSILYAVSPGDPLTVAAIALLVAVIALLASYLPARRAMRIDPTDALRTD